MSEQIRHLALSALMWLIPCDPQGNYTAKLERSQTSPDDKYRLV